MVKLSSPYASSGLLENDTAWLDGQANGAATRRKETVAEVCPGAAV